MFKIGKSAKLHPCPICGYGLEYPPDDYEICPSCGVEFGYETAGRSFAELRNEWIATGAHWASPVDKPPKGWNPWQQLSNAGFVRNVRVKIDYYGNSARGGGMRIVHVSVPIASAVRFA
jgi:hypothetical protein